MDWTLNQPDLREFGEDFVRLLVAVLLGGLSGVEVCMDEWREFEQQSDNYLRSACSSF